MGIPQNFNQMSTHISCQAESPSQQSESVREESSLYTLEEVKAYTYIDIYIYKKNHLEKLIKQ